MNDFKALFAPIQLEPVIINPQDIRFVQESSIDSAYENEAKAIELNPTNTNNKQTDSEHESELEHKNIQEDIDNNKNIENEETSISSSNENEDESKTIQINMKINSNNKHKLNENESEIDEELNNEIIGIKKIIIKQGWLIKPKRFLYTKKWFVLKNLLLYEFKDINNIYNKPEKIINLKNCIGISDINYINKDKLLFDIILKNERKTFKALNINEKNSWINNINNIISKIFIKNKNINNWNNNEFIIYIQNINNNKLTKNEKQLLIQKIKDKKQFNGKYIMDLWENDKLNLFINQINIDKVLTKKFNKIS